MRNQEGKTELQKKVHCVRDITFLTVGRSFYVISAAFIVYSLLLPK